MEASKAAVCYVRNTSTPAVCSAQYRSFPDGGDYLVAWQGKIFGRSKQDAPTSAPYLARIGPIGSKP
jgi:hypothetical protein